MSMETTIPPSGPPSGPASGMRGWVKALFILSLTLNFLVLGTVVGGVIAHRMAPPPGLDRGADALTFGPLGGAFDRDDRRAMRRAAEGQGADFEAIQATMLSDFARLGAALTAEPFDPAAVRAVLVEMRARTIKRMDMGESLMLARLEAMSPEARVAFVARLNRGVERFERHLGDHRPRGPGPEGPGADD